MPYASATACPHCAAPVSSTDNFCEACGGELTPPQVSSGDGSQGYCQNCGAGQLSADGYCEQCGRKAPSPRDHVEIDLGTLFGLTDRGVRHHRNEDAMALTLTQTPGGRVALAVVCDGVSTSDRPDEASLAAADTALQALADALRVGAEPAAALTAAVKAADTAVHELAGQSANAPATTIVSAVLTAQAVTVCWVGDSRAYWLPADPRSSGQLLTRDDSLASELAASGAYSEADAMTSPHRHVVTRWLGADGDADEPHTAHAKPAGPGVLLLCTDGLWNYEPAPDGLARIALPRAVGDISGASTDLLQYALAAGGQDNITIVLGAFPPG
jgi:serine/threonine protein phosphatase PrpC